ncbi:MAG: hypothetical protein GWN00_19745 [Aliifodinibius sp.]|nr:hypothetical protein [Fodinibius sp.]NIY26956.1 hypothetical protein [Fodinibius sp.]
MSPVDAIKLINWFPRTTDCVLRGGQADYATGITGAVKTLAVYNRPNGTNQMFAADNNDVWDVSSSGAASAQSATVTDGEFQWLNFGDGTNQYLMMFNGVDSPLYYNGTTWTSITGVSSPALTGLTTSNIIQANEHKGRLYFIEKDSLSFWYLPAGAAGGALTEFDLSSFCKKGGYLMWMATWSFDAGDGPDDAAVFMTSEGEVIVYRGTDPSTAANWVLTGVYQIGDPIGRRSFIKFGGDLLVITQNGVFPLSKALQSADIDNVSAVTNKIEKAFTEAVRDYGANFGWEAVSYPLQSAMLFNIPVSEGSEYKQYVMNTITSAWCEFDSWNGTCFAVYNDELYYGGSTVVQKAWTGTSDDGADIVGVAKTAFNYFGGISQQKRFNLFRPMIQVNGNISFLTGFDIDFSDNEITGEAVYSVTAKAVWDTSEWDNAYWAAGLDVVKQWTSPTPNVGYCVSGGLKVNTSELEIYWVANDYVFETGGIL